MLKLTLCFVLVSAAYVLGAPFDDDINREPRRITTLPPDAVFKCKEAKFKDYNKKCCKVQPGDFFEASAMRTCNPAPRNNDNVNYIKDYVLNENQEVKNNNVIDYADKAVIKKLGKPACFVECLFKNEKLIKANGNIDNSALTNYLQTQAPEIWDAPVKEAVDICSDLVADFLTVTITTEERTPRTCSALPMMMMQCIRFNLIGACPENNEPTERIPKECAAGTHAQENCGGIFSPLSK